MNSDAFGPSAGRRAVLCAAFAVCSVLPVGLEAQSDEIAEYFDRVFPTATRFGPREGDPPVYRAFAADSVTGVEAHVGFVFFTPDIPPETTGYSAPVQVLVGMDLAGTLTGVRVISYRESLRSSRGDFLSRAGIQSQFAGKSIMDEFRVRRDVETVTGATITVVALATGVRNAARRVAATYMTRARFASGPLPRMGSISLESLDRLTWPEVMALDLATEIVGDVGRGGDLLRITVSYLRDLEMAEAVIGTTRYERIADALTEATDKHMMFIGMNGPNIILFPPESISFVQGADTVRTVRADFQSTGLLPDGKAAGVFRRSGVLLVGQELDVLQSFTVVVDLGNGSSASREYVAFDPPPAVAATPSPGPGTAEPVTAAPTPAGTPRAEPAAEPVVTSEAPAEATQPVGALATRQVTPQTVPTFDFTDEELAELLFPQEEEETSALARTLAQTSWPRVIGLILLLALVTWAFVAKRPGLRWVALAGTLAFLGFLDRGFLSVSHILAGISVGPEVYLGDLSLLILASFTLVTTLFWGRVFCGFLCPFGALQDLLEKVVPKSVRREFSRPVHERALFAKYGILGIVVAPAILSAPFTLYHFFEPFGTVFYWSPSITLWSIAIGILVASAIVPRFYCRYMCPLGAALAIGSLLSPFRIRRVEQCTVCKVCEQKCPTGAIRLERVDFKECVRCNVCETQLIEKAGVCRHEMEEIRPRLVQLKAAHASSGRERVGR